MRSCMPYEGILVKASLKKTTITLLSLPTEDRPEHLVKLSTRNEYIEEIVKWTNLYCTGLRKWGNSFAPIRNGRHKAQGIIAPRESDTTRCLPRGHDRKPPGQGHASRHANTATEAKNAVVPPSTPSQREGRRPKSAAAKAMREEAAAQVAPTAPAKKAKVVSPPEAEAKI